MTGNRPAVISRTFKAPSCAHQKSGGDARKRTLSSVLLARVLIRSLIRSNFVCAAAAASVITGPMESPFARHRPASNRFEKELVMTRLSSLVRGSKTIELTRGEIAKPPRGLHVTANCHTSGRTRRTRSTTAILSGLSPDRATESRIVASLMYRSVSNKRSVEGTAIDRGQAAAIAAAAY